MIKRITSTLFISLPCFLILLQIILAIALSTDLDLDEPYPFSNWSLFQRVEKNKIIPLIFVKKLETKEFEPPLSIYQLISPNDPNIDFLHIHDNLQRLLQNSLNDELTDNENIIKDIERSLFTKVKQAEYWIEFVEADSYQFMKDGSYHTSTYRSPLYYYDGENND